MNDVNLELEEVRGLFVLGVIAALLSVRGFTDFPLLQDLTFRAAINVLIVYWGLYVFFMALAVSHDWINQRVAKRCHYLAKQLFIAGICSTCGAVVVMVLSYLFPTFVSTTLGLVIVWGLAVLLVLVAGWEISP